MWDLIYSNENNIYLFVQNCWIELGAVELNERSIAQIQPGSSMEMDHLIAQIPSGSLSVQNSGLWKDLSPVENLVI